MCDLNIGDRVVCIKESEYFTNGKSYEIQWIGVLGNTKHVTVIDDDNEENCLTIPFLNIHFKKIDVIIHIYNDNFFTTETNMGTIDWIDNSYTLDTLIELLDNLGVGYELNIK